MDVGLLKLHTMALTGSTRAPAHHQRSEAFTRSASKALLRAGQNISQRYTRADPRKTPRKTPRMGMLGRGVNTTSKPGQGAGGGATVNPPPPGTRSPRKTHRPARTG